MLATRPQWRQAVAAATSREAPAMAALAGEEREGRRGTVAVQERERKEPTPLERARLERLEATAIMDQEAQAQQAQRPATRHNQLRSRSGPQRLAVQPVLAAAQEAAAAAVLRLEEADVMVGLAAADETMLPASRLARPGKVY